MICKKVLVISEYNLSDSWGAAYERIKCYANAMPGTDFICLHPDLNFSNSLKYETKNSYNNLFIPTVYPNKNGFIYRNFIRYIDFYRPLKLCKYILSNYDPNKTKILLYSSSFPLFYLIIKMKFRHDFIVIVEKNEIETAIISNLQFPRGWSFIVFLILLPYRYFTAFLLDQLTSKASGIIAISTRIFTKYSNLKMNILIPVLIDLDRFKCKMIEHNEHKIRFIYIGAITKRKDNIEELIKSLKNLIKKNDNFHVDIVGGGSRHYINKLNRFISKNKLSGLINIKKLVKNNEIPDLLKHYDYGLLIRSKNWQTQYGFSTKLGEYLAAGLPVIFSEVSDNLLYLEDKVHGFLAQFPLKTNLEQTLEMAILTLPEERQTMSKNAIRLARTSFDYRVHADKLKKIFA